MARPAVVSGWSRAPTSIKTVRLAGLVSFIGREVEEAQGWKSLLAAHRQQQSEEGPAHVHTLAGRHKSASSTWSRRGGGRESLPRKKEETPGKGRLCFLQTL